MLREDHRLTVLPFDKVQIADIPTRTREIITIGALPPNAHARGSATQPSPPRHCLRLHSSPVIGTSCRFRAGQVRPKSAGWTRILRVQGIRSWQTIAVSRNGKALAVILGNPAMINAYQSGIPGNGKPFPDGAKMAKVHWAPKVNSSSRMRRCRASWRTWTSW